MTEPRECGNCGNKDCELCHEPREEGGKEFWAKFDLNKWLEDAKEVGEIIRKTMEREKKFIKVNPDDFKNLEWKTTNPDEEAALSKNEGEGHVTTKIYVDRTENKIDKVVINGKEFVSKAGEKEGEGWAELHKLLEEAMQLSPELCKFIRQHFISRTAVEKIIEGMIEELKSKGADGEEWGEGRYSALRDLQEKINKG